MNLSCENAGALKTVLAICREVKREGGCAYAVGGCVRDAALDLPVKDIDMEIFHIPPERLLEMLSRHFEIDLVGQSFGVIKVRHLPIDIAIPRRESKNGAGHRAFAIQSDPALSRREAAARRDFTINAMALDPLTDELFDPFHGLDDLHQRILRHTTHRFAEDPLRVLRGMQFTARFSLNAAPETIELCRTIHPEGLSPERIFDEWKKLILLGRRPSLGLRFLNDCGWIQYFPELQALIGCPQDPRWHPEGDVWNHTLLALDAFAAQRLGDETEDLTVGLAVLCHDLGKPLCTTADPDGHIRSIDHERAAEAPTRAFLNRMTTQHSLVEDVVTLVLHHMRPHELFQANASDSAVRRLAAAVKRIDRLIRVDRADRSGRTPAGETDQRCGDWLLQKAQQLEIESAAPRPLIMGRHLRQLGLPPGKTFGPLLKTCYEAQLEGLITDESDGIAYLKRLLDQHDKETGPKP